jgi:hypothetical protein
MILLWCILTSLLSTTCFGSSYEPSSGWLLFLSKVKYTISNAIVIVYEISYIVQNFDVKFIPLYNSIKINLVDGSNFAEHASESDHEYDAIHEIMDIAKLLENVHYWMYMKETMSVCIWRNIVFLMNLVFQSTYYFISLQRDGTLGHWHTDRRAYAQRHDRFVVLQHWIKLFLL